MNYCWNKKRNMVLNGLKVLFALILLFVVIAETILYISPRITSSLADNLFYVIIACAVAVFCGIFIRLIVANERKYKVDERGLTIGYPFGIQRFYAWNEVTSAAICKVRYIKKGPLQYKTAIRFVIGEEKTGPEQAKKADESWSEEMYEIMHWEKIITIEFSEDRLNTVRSICPLNISDYRHLPDPHK